MSDHSLNMGPCRVEVQHEHGVPAAKYVSWLAKTVFDRLLQNTVLVRLSGCTSGLACLPSHCSFVLPTRSHCAWACRQEHGLLWGPWCDTSRGLKMDSRTAEPAKRSHRTYFLVQRQSSPINWPWSRGLDWRKPPSWPGCEDGVGPEFQDAK